MNLSTWPVLSLVDCWNVPKRGGTRCEEGHRRLQSMLVLWLQSLWVCVGKAITRQPLVLLQVTWAFCHLLVWKSAPNPILFLPVLGIVETELGTGRKGKSWGYWDSCRSPGARCNPLWWVRVLSNLSTQQTWDRLPHLYPFLVPVYLPSAAGVREKNGFALCL